MYGKEPTFAPGQRLAWPPQSSLAVMVAQSMVPFVRPTLQRRLGGRAGGGQCQAPAGRSRWAADEAARQAEHKRVYEASLQR